MHAKYCKIVVKLGKSMYYMYCKSNNIRSCRDGVHCITTSGKSCDGLVLCLPDEWAIQCAMRTEHEFEGIWYTSIQPMRFHERQCECVTVCYWNILNSFETSKKWDMLFPASLFTEVYWTGPRFHPSTFVALAFPGLQRHGTTYRCWVVPQGSPGRFDARTHGWSSLGKGGILTPGVFHTFHATQNTQKPCWISWWLWWFQNVADVESMLNVQKLYAWTRPTSTPWSLMLLLARMARTMTTRCSTWNGNSLSMMTSCSKFTKDVFRFNEALILSSFIDYTLWWTNILPWKMAHL